MSVSQGLRKPRVLDFQHGVDQTATIHSNSTRGVACFGAGDRASYQAPQAKTQPVDSEDANKK
eukprot:scaffold234932_cov22-Prasinocladus_malaysianus.AAC.1